MSLVLKTIEDSKRAEPVPEAYLEFVWSVVVCKLVEGFLLMKPTQFGRLLLSFAVFHLCSISLKDLNDNLFSIFEKKTRNLKCLA